MYFPSKKDMLFRIVFWGIIVFLIAIYFTGYEPSRGQIVTYDSLIGIIINVILIGFMIWLWFGTGYTLEDGVIRIQSGPFRKKVPVKKIQKIRKTKNPLSAPALSMDRIEITYGLYEVVLISPEHEAEFIQALLAENERIELDSILSEKIRLKKRGEKSPN